MPVPAEDHRSRRLRVGGNADERGPLHAVDRPGALGEAFRRAAREQFAKLPLRGRLDGSQER